MTPKVSQEPPELEPEIDFDDFLNIRTNRVASGLSLVFQRESLRPAGLSIQEWRALLNLTLAGDCHLRGLARMARLDVGHISRATSSLEEKDLIRSYEDSNDMRRKLLSVTQKGKATVAEVWPKALDLNHRIEQRVGKTRFRNFKLVLRDINAYTDELLGGVDELNILE